jgi:SAM-dependent methyltransferase
MLDVGIGPGTITVDLAERLADGSVIGIDSAPAAVVATQTLALGRGASNIQVLIGDVYTMPFPDASFDVVHAHQLLQHLSDPVAALREMRRVCVPGGLVAVRDPDYATITWYPPNAALTRWLELIVTWRRATAANQTPAVGSSAGHLPRVSVMSLRRRAPGASRRRQISPGGPRPGLSGCVSPTSVGRPRHAGSPTPRNWAK